jgi:hypothetical protein
MVIDTFRMNCPIRKYENSDPKSRIFRVKKDFNYSNTLFSKEILALEMFPKELISNSTKFTTVSTP